MPYRQIPDHTADSPLRHWLRANLPDEPPLPAGPLTWQVARRYADGALLRDLATEAGPTPDAIESRVRYLAKTLGYQPGGATAWLLPNGELAPHAARRDEATSCLLWTGHLAPTSTGPYAPLPQSHWPAGHTSSQGPRVQVRQFLWERLHGPVPRGFIVLTRCGNARCVEPKHAEVRSPQKKLSPDDLASVVERKADESRSQAAARLGVSVETVGLLRGPGGKRQTSPSLLRSWLIEHLPAHQPAHVDELTWSFARRYTAGETLEVIGRDAGVTRQAVQQRIRWMATQLGDDRGATDTPTTKLRDRPKSPRRGRPG